MTKWAGKNRWLSENPVLQSESSGNTLSDLSVRILVPISALWQLGFSHPFTVLVCMVPTGNSCACGGRPWLPTINRAVFLGMIKPSWSYQDSHFRIFLKNKQHWLLNLLCRKEGSCNGPEGIFHHSFLNAWLIFRKFGLCFSMWEVFYIWWLGICLQH